MTDLSPDAKELIELSRDEDSPTSDDRARVRRALAATLSVGAASASSSAAAATKSALGAAGAAKGTVGAWLALGIVAGLAGSAAVFVGVPSLRAPSPDAHDGAGVRVATPHTPTTDVRTADAPPPARPALPDAPASRAELRSSTTDVAGAGPSGAGSLLAAPRPSPTTPLAAAGTPKNQAAARSGTPATQATDGVVARPAQAAAASLTEAPDTAEHTVAAPPPPSSLGAETSLLERARAALSRGDAPGALALLDQHEQSFPGGALVEERLATRVFALCSLGRRADAARTAARLLELSPASPLRARVLDSCAFSH